MLVDVDGGRLAALARSIGEDRVDHVVADVADAAQVKGFVERTVARFGGVDIALLNAGIEGRVAPRLEQRSEEHTSELQSLMRISYAVFCLKKKKNSKTTITQDRTIQ